VQHFVDTSFPVHKTKSKTSHNPLLYNTAAAPFGNGLARPPGPLVHKKHAGLNPGQFKITSGRSRNQVSGRRWSLEQASPSRRRFRSRSVTRSLAIESPEQVVQDGNNLLPISHLFPVLNPRLRFQ